MALPAGHPQSHRFFGRHRNPFPEPVPATSENAQIAEMFLQSRAGGGGTQMMQAIQASLTPTGRTGRLRIVCFMTDAHF